MKNDERNLIFIASFDKNLGNFLTECRNNALEELKSDSRYADWKHKQSELRSKLEAVISAEAVKLFEEYSETSGAVQSMEFNKVFLCGLTTHADIRRRFDAASAEYPVFAKEYL